MEKIINSIKRDPIYYGITAVGLVAALVTYGFEPTAITVLVFATAIFLYIQLIRTYSYIKHRNNKFNNLSITTTIILTGLTIIFAAEFLFFAVIFSVILTVISVLCGKG